MSGRYLLDTNVAIRLLNQEIAITSRRGSDLEMFLSLVVVGELLFGAKLSSQPALNRARIDGLSELCPVVPQDLATADHYGSLKADLRRKGRPIPDNDIWIAACALRHGLILATNDQHFDQVEDLKIESW
jgi:tRNA(fMet)-specific endonuclease VapC